MKQWPIFRDVLLFTGGLAGVLHETLLTSSERPTLLILFAAMMGLPAFLRQPTGPPEDAPAPPPQAPPPARRPQEEGPGGTA
jgi:hypothetical protein